MFNLNEGNRFLMSQNSTDLRRGINGLCGDIRRVGLVPNNGEVFRGHSLETSRARYRRTDIKFMIQVS